LNGYCECVGGSNLISGQVFLDMDLNGSFNAGDVPLPNRTIQVSPGNRYTVSDPARGLLHHRPIRQLHAHGTPG